MDCGDMIDWLINYGDMTNCVNMMNKLYDWLIGRIMEGGSKRGAADGDVSGEGRETRKKAKVDYNEEKIISAKKEVN